MNEAVVGRILPASLHQGIADLLPSRLEFYEEWLNPKAMRDGRIGLAPLAAVLSFLRREGDVYQPIAARAGEYAAEWTYADVSALRRSVIRAAPVWLRLRLVAGLARRLTVRTYSDCRVSVQWKKQTGTVGMAGSLFCVVREPAGQPLCGFYAAAIRRLMALGGLDVEVTPQQCRATGAERCAMTIQLRAS
jgi:predicted hydrocarbon binding protein